MLLDAKADVNWMSAVRGVVWWCVWVVCVVVCVWVVCVGDMVFCERVNVVNVALIARVPVCQGNDNATSIAMVTIMHHHQS